MYKVLEVAGGYILVGIAFILFVVVNGGIVEVQSYKYVYIAWIQFQLFSHTYGLLYIYLYTPFLS